MNATITETDSSPVSVQRHLEGKPFWWIATDGRYEIFESEGRIATAESEPSAWMIVNALNVVAQLSSKFFAPKESK